MKQKNHEFLIDIFAEIAKNRDDAELLLIGDGPLRTTIRDKVCSLNLNDKVRFLGSRKDVYELYNVMDAFVLPSYYEGLPVVGVEVQSNGLPFWCSDKITEEVIITDNIHRISLKKNVKYWADSIISSKRSYNQQKILKNLELAGFDIVTEAKKLEERYLKWIE